MSEIVLGAVLKGGKQCPSMLASSTMRVATAKRCCGPTPGDLLVRAQSSVCQFSRKGYVEQQVCTTIHQVTPCVSRMVCMR